MSCCHYWVLDFGCRVSQDRQSSMDSKQGFFTDRTRIVLQCKSDMGIMQIIWRADADIIFSPLRLFFVYVPVKPLKLCKKIRFGKITVNAPTLSLGSSAATNILPVSFIAFMCLESTYPATLINANFFHKNDLSSSLIEFGYIVFHWILISLFSYSRFL